MIRRNWPWVERGREEEFLRWGKSSSDQIEWIVVRPNCTLSDLIGEWCLLQQRIRSEYSRYLKEEKDPFFNSIRGEAMRSSLRARMNDEELCSSKKRLVEFDQRMISPLGKSLRPSNPRAFFSHHCASIRFVIIVTNCSSRERIEDLPVAQVKCE